MWGETPEFDEEQEVAWPILDIGSISANTCHCSSLHYGHDEVIRDPVSQV